MPESNAEPLLPVPDYAVCAHRSRTGRQVAAHQEAVALFATYAQSGEDPSLRAFAQSALSTLQHHLGMARRLPR
ncbi:MAG: DUF4142 domain-containing protein [Microvirga sp.]